MMNNARQILLSFYSGIFVEIVRPQPHLVNAVTAADLKETMSLVHDRALGICGLHREHSFTIDDTCALVRKTSVRGVSHDAPLPFSLQVAIDGLRRRRVTLDSSI